MYGNAWGRHTDRDNCYVSRYTCVRQWTFQSPNNLLVMGSVLREELGLVGSLAGLIKNMKKVDEDYLIQYSLCRRRNYVCQKSKK